MKKNNWYRNREGYPMVSLMETMFNDTQLYKREINELMVVKSDIKLFYNQCASFDLLHGSYRTLKNNAFSNEVFDSLKNKMTIVIKERQIGYSTIEAVVALFYTQMLNKCVAIIDTGNMMERIKNIYVRLPSHLKFGIRKLTKKCIKFSNGTFIRIEKQYVTYSPDLIIYDEYDFLASRKLKDFIRNIAPSISARVGDQLLLGSTLSGKKREGSFDDLLNNSIYGVYNFNMLDLTKVEDLKKQFDRNSKIDNLLNK